MKEEVKEEVKPDLGIMNREDHSDDDMFERIEESVIVPPTEEEVKVEESFKI